MLSATIVKILKTPTMKFMRRTSVKKCVLAMSMRFSYDPTEIVRVSHEVRPIGISIAGGSTNCTSTSNRSTGQAFHR
jgi:hypothetical protein